MFSFLTFLRTELLQEIFWKLSWKSVPHVISSPNHRSLDDTEVKNRAGRDWNTMVLEFDDLPEFEDCYVRVAAFYRSLPWDGA